jgi:hypothetical protein
VKSLLSRTEQFVMFNNFYFISVILFLNVSPIASAEQPAQSFTLSGCGQPMSIIFSGTFDAYETACTQFRAKSLLEVVNISFYFDDIEHTSSPADLDLTITSLQSQVALHIGGWDDDARITEDIEWPNQWQFSAEAGLYSAVLDVKKAYLDDDGVYEICVMNKWLNSGQAIYNGLIDLVGMTSDCSATNSPTATPEISVPAASSSECAGQTKVDVAFDLSFSGRDTKCITPFFAQGDLLAMNIDLTFTSKQMYLGILPVKQTMWPADLELSLTQLSSNVSVVVGYDALDNEFSGDDDGLDNDSGSYFYGFSLNASNVVTNLMSAPLWLSPSSALTEVMSSNVESCDQSFCSEFTSATFMSHGSADSNQYYPRYLKNMTAPFNLNSQILKNYACDDHFFVFSRHPLGSPFSYSVLPDTLTFAWDCKHKFIFTEDGETRRGEYCGKTGFYDVDVGIDAEGFAYFRDNICGEMKMELSDASGPWYLFIGRWERARTTVGIAAKRFI